jgi:hypothetical protein
VHRLSSTARAGAPRSRLVTRRWARLAACVALAGPALASTVARADEPAVVDADLLAQQRQIFDRANKLYDAHKLPEALAAYMDAWNLRHTFDVAGNLGNLEADLERWRPAAEHLAFAVREFPAGGKPSARDKLLERLAEAEKHTGHLRVQVNRTGAQVFVDGAPAGLAPIAGFVYVDPGPHVVEARLDGYAPLRENVIADKERTDDVPLTFPTKSGANRTVIIVGGAVAGASAVAGAVLAGLWASKGSSATSLAGQVPRSAPCPLDGTGATGTCGSLASALRARAAFGDGAVGAFVAAGAVGAATLVYALVAGPRGPRTTGLWATPLVSPTAGGVLVGSSF